LILTEAPFNIDSYAQRLENCLQMPSTFSSKLAPITLPDADSHPVRLGSLWEKTPAVIVFLRHWG
jgi:hypothetical protein